METPSLQPWRRRSSFSADAAKQFLTDELGPSAIGSGPSATRVFQCRDLPPPRNFGKPTSGALPLAYPLAQTELSPTSILSPEHLAQSFRSTFANFQRTACRQRKRERCQIIERRRRIDPSQLLPADLATPVAIDPPRGELTKRVRSNVYSSRCNGGMVCCSRHLCARVHYQAMQFRASCQFHEENSRSFVYNWRSQRRR